jgi:hypothetical protein
MSSVTQTCPPLEDIAAFLDGKLSEGERARIIAHLADCQSCYTVFADAARFQLEEEREAEETGKSPIPFPRKAAASKRWALPLAALLILGLAAVPLYLRYSRMPEMLSAELVDPAALAQVPSSSFWSEDMRGGPGAASSDSESFEFLLGAHLVDLRLTLTRNDRQQSQNVLSRINGDTKQLLFVDEKQSEFYLEAAKNIYEGQEPKEWTEKAARVEAELTESLSSPESPYLAFGKWTEAGRLSAVARNRDFFEDRDNRLYLSWFLRKAKANDIPDAVVRVLRRMSDTLENSDPPKLPYDALEGQFEAILKYYQAEADVASGP